MQSVIIPKMGAKTLQQIMILLDLGAVLNVFANMKVEKGQLENNSYKVF